MHPLLRQLGVAIILFVFGIAVLSLGWNITAPISAEANRWLIAALCVGIVLLQP